MENFRLLVKEFLSSEILVYSLYVYLFILVFYMVYCALNYFKYYSRMQRTIQSLYAHMNEQERSRAQAERQQRDIHGAGGKRDILARLDEELAYSGIKDKIKWMTTEIYIIITLVLIAIVLTISTIIYGPVIGIIAGALTYIGLRAIIAAIVSIRNKNTESVMLQFMNIVDNLSRTSDDLISILEKASRYIEDPLSNQIYSAVVEARNTGDTLLALQELQDRVKNKHFKVLMRNLEISSRFETNYSDIVEDCRDIFHNYLKSEKEKRNIRISGLLEILTMLGCGAVCIYLIGDIVDNKNIAVTLIKGGPVGIGILALLTFSAVGSVYLAAFKVLKDKG